MQVSIETDHQPFVYWPFAMANAVHLWTAASQRRIWCVADDADLLAEAFHSGAARVWCTDLAGSNEPPPEARFDTIVVIPGPDTNQLREICRRLESGGYLFVWTTPRLALQCQSHVAGAGLRIACRYLISHSLSRPAHLVPDRVEAVLAQIDVMRGLSGVNGWLKRVAVHLGWRPKVFTARLLVARR